MKKTKEQKTGMHISLVGTPEELIRLKNIIVAARGKAEIVMMSEALKEETLTDSQDEKKEEKPESFDGKIYTREWEDDEHISIFIAKGEAYKLRFGECPTVIDAYVSIYVELNTMHPIDMITDRNVLTYLTEPIRPATQDEINLLRIVIQERGLIWNDERRQLLKRNEHDEWTSVHEKPCWACYYYQERKSFTPLYFNEGEVYHEEIKRGWAFPTKQDCQRMCDKLNAAILQTSINEQIGL